ncbi:MAG: homoserine kinase [Alkalinema sp. CACIAM 70d]|nr:MAG: homoserine kinase [Alkalinema sp. CACIAM 70d]
MSVCVRVPATTANIGPGFDCLGAALTLYNEFVFSPHPTGQTLEITVTGVNADRVGTDADNMVYQAFLKVFEKLGQPVSPLRLEIAMNVPLARGLGSSATAIVGGLVGANELAGKPLSSAELAAIATEIEGHPDNVVPALLGGCRLAASGVVRDWEICELAWNPAVVPVVAIPDFELSTEAARKVLPQDYSRADAVFNMAHLGLLLQGLATGNGDWLKAALQDKIHQPYRKSLIPGYDAIEQAAQAAGAYGVVISGAGPTVLALAPQAIGETVKTAMEQAWASQGITAQAMVLALDTQGTVVG